MQLYLHDPVAAVVRPVQRLIGFHRLALSARRGAPGRPFRVPADLASFTGREGHRIVEPGTLELRLAASSTDPRLTVEIVLTGPVRRLDHTRRLHAVFTPVSAGPRSV